MMATSPPRRHVEPNPVPPCMAKVASRAMTSRWCRYTLPVLGLGTRILLLPEPYCAAMTDGRPGLTIRVVSPDASSDTSCAAVPNGSGRLERSPAGWASSISCHHERISDEFTTGTPWTTANHQKGHRPVHRESARYASCTSGGSATVLQVAQPHHGLP